MGSYSFTNLSPSTKIIQSQINPSSLPSIKFPSATVPSDTPKDPVIKNVGLQFSYNKYVDISSKWSQNLNVSTDLSLWLFYSSGELGTFIQVGLENYLGVPRLISISGNITSGTQYFYGHIGTFAPQIKQVMHGWNLITFNLWNDCFERNICYQGI